MAYKDATSNVYAIGHQIDVDERNGLRQYHVKFGYCDNTSHRRSQLQTADAHELEIYATQATARPKAVERKLENRFTDSWLRGEWHLLPEPAVQSLIYDVDTAVQEVATDAEIVHEIQARLNRWDT